MGTIAVIGATGTVGERLVQRLAGGSHRVRAVCRNPEAVAGRVDESRPGDLTNPKHAERALEGVSAVYLTPPLAGDDPIGTETAVCHNLIDAAVKQGVEHLVMHSALRANRGDTGARILDNKTPIEVALADSGLGYTIIRPAWFLQNLWGAKGYLEQAVFSMPWPGDMAWGATDVEDIVSAAVHFLEHGPANAGYDVHLPGGVTGDGIAQTAGAVLGHDVAYHEAEVSTREYVEAFPISNSHKDLYAELFDYFRSTTYLEDPHAISEIVESVGKRGLKDFFVDELFAKE